MAGTSTFWKFIKSKVTPHHSAAPNIQLEKGEQYGVPESPSALAYEPQLDLLAIGTAHGVIRVFGAPGVEFTYGQEKQSAVKHLFFASNYGKIVVIYDGGLIELLEIAVADGITSFGLAKHIQNSSIEGITSAAVQKNFASTFIYIGTASGQVFSIVPETLEMEDVSSIFEISRADNEDPLTAETKTDGDVPDQTPTPPTRGAIVALAPHPNNSHLLAVGFDNGTAMVCDMKLKTVVHIFPHDQAVTSLTWRSNGLMLYASYSDGGYRVWLLSGESEGRTGTVPYGPYPCFPMDKILVSSQPGGGDQPTLTFSGGLPKDRFGSHHSITILNGAKHDALDFPVAVVDFLLLYPKGQEESEEAHTLLVLLENQLIAIDLTSDKYPEIQTPYMILMHPPVTTFQYYSAVPGDLLDHLTDITSKPTELRPFGAFLHRFSQRDWPVNGGEIVTEEMPSRSLLITAHADGSIRFWEISSYRLKFLHKLDAPSRYFHVNAADADTVDDSRGSSYEIWPPFRKYGVEKDVSADPRLRIEQIAFDPVARTLAVGGQAGQVIVYSFNPQYTIVNFRTLNVDIVSEEYQYIWRGSQPLPVRSGNLEAFGGFQGQFNVQLQPPSQITSLYLHPEWKLMAVGTAHGFVLVDYVSQLNIFSHCTLDKGDSLEAPETIQQKAKRAGDTLRRSLRRLPRPHILRTPSSPLTENGKSGIYRKTVSASPLPPVAASAITVETSKTEVVSENGEKVTDEVKVIHMENGDDDEKRTEKIEESALLNGTSETVTNGMEHDSKEVISPMEPMSSGADDSAEEDTLPAVILEAEKVKEEKEQQAMERVYNIETTTVRSLMLADAVVTEDQSVSPCLFVGLNNGTVYIYTIPLLSPGSRISIPLTDPQSTSTTGGVKLSKEIHLRHGAPVISMAVLSGSGKTGKGTEMTKSQTSLGMSTSAVTAVESTERTAGTSTPTVEEITERVDVASPVSDITPLRGGDKGPGRLLVASEEQIKIFQLPSLKPICKYKLSNGRFRKVQIVRMTPAGDLSEKGDDQNLLISAITSRGDGEVLSLPSLKRQLRANLAKKEDISACLTGDGKGIFQSGTNELQLFSLKQTINQNGESVVKAPFRCVIDLPVVKVEEVTVADEPMLEQTQTDELREQTIVIPAVEEPAVLTVELQDSVTIPAPPPPTPSAASFASEEKTFEIPADINTLAPFFKITTAVPDIAIVLHTEKTTVVKDETTGDVQIVTKVVEEVLVLSGEEGAGDADKSGVSDLDKSGLSLGDMDMSSDSIIDHVTPSKDMLTNLNEEDAMMAGKKLNDDFASAEDQQEPAVVNAHVVAQ